MLSDALPPGHYSLTSSKPGFQSARRDGIDLHLDQRLRVDLDLSIAVAPATITVSPDVQTETASLGKVIVACEIRDLPLLSRNFQDLLLLVPGVAPGAGGNISNYAVNGQREFANSIVINGTEVTGNRNNDSNLRPSVDAVEEFKAITSSYGAEDSDALRHERLPRSRFRIPAHKQNHRQKLLLTRAVAVEGEFLRRNAWRPAAPRQNILLCRLRREAHPRHVFVSDQHRPNMGWS